MRDSKAGASGRSIAIVGMGPRGLSVLERLLVRLQQGAGGRGVVIWVIDPVEHGPGRVWRTSQPLWLTMNATASEVTVHSPDSHLPDGDLFSLDAWTAGVACPASPVDPVDNPPRKVYGQYLREVFERLCAGAPPGVEVRPLLGEATALRRDRAGSLCLEVDGGRRELRVDKVVLATGHSAIEPTPEQRGFRRHARRHPGCTYIEDDIAADMPLDDIPPGATVAIRGLGLTFYDLVRALSIGRGGTFERDGSGRLGYVPSGREPRIVAGSRSGLPFRARPRVMQPPETAPRPVVITEARIAGLRADALARRGTVKLDFAKEVEPLVQAEVELAYHACAARLRGGNVAADRFTADFVEGIGRPGRPELLARHGLGDVPPLCLDALGRPFRGETFDSHESFRDRLLEVLRDDVTESRMGVAASPVKAALEVLRQIRPLLPTVVDFGGLLPESHRDFLARFEPLSYLLSAGPPDEHVEQLVALIEAGVVDVVGPGARFAADEPSGRFTVSSAQVAGWSCPAEVLIDARVPTVDLRRTASPLLHQMAADRMVSQYVNVEPVTGARFATGGLSVVPGPPFQVINRRGGPDPDIYAIGVAVDRTRWFTQVGTGRPGKDSPFRSDADAIAVDALGMSPATDGHSDSNKRRHVLAIDAATAETRRRRIDKSVATVHEGRV